MTYHIVTRAVSGAASETVTSGADGLGLGIWVPILAFLFVFVIMFALLMKTKVLGESPWIVVFISLFIAIIFASVGSVRQLVLGIVPWFAVLVIILFSILVLIGFIGGGAEGIAGKGLGLIFIIIFLVIVLILGLNVFGGDASAYLPGPFFGVGEDTSPGFLLFFSWLYSPRIASSIGLIISAIVVTWILIAFGD